MNENSAGVGPVERGVRPLALLLVACLLAACSRDPVATTATDNAQIKVERLFDHDGCTVYRFYDGGTRYFVKCRDGSTRAPSGAKATRAARACAAARWPCLGPNVGAKLAERQRGSA